MQKLFFWQCVLLLQLILNCYTSNVKAGTTSTDPSLEQILNDRLNAQPHTEEKLSRKRRYLIFPEGSSFQLVYDEIIGVVDYTNYLILGITVALAWELPSKPPSEILTDLRDRLNDGTLGISRNDTIEQIKYIDKKPTNKTKNYPAAAIMQNALKQHYPLINYVPLHKNQNNNNKYYGNYHKPSYYKPLHWRRKDSYYFSARPNPFKKWTQQKPTSQYTTPIQHSSYPWWQKYSRPSVYGVSQQANVSYANPASSRRQHAQRKQPKNLQHSQTSGNYQSTTSPPRKHRIHPIFGKRSVRMHKQQRQEQQHLSHHRRSRSDGSSIAEAELGKLDRIHIRHHRNTRQTFYEKIEKYLDKRGANGHHCVLRALCETGQKSHEVQPGSFVAELMRAVFTLPEPFENDYTHYKDKRYDEAHASTADCAATYHLCEHSLWTSQFIM